MAARGRDSRVVQGHPYRSLEIETFSTIAPSKPLAANPFPAYGFASAHEKTPDALAPAFCVVRYSMANGCVRVFVIGLGKPHSFSSDRQASEAENLFLCYFAHELLIISIFL